jgi:hypothetical protein
MLEIAKKYTYGWPKMGLAPNPDEAMKWIERAMAASGEPEGEFMPTHGMVDPYEVARQRGDDPPPRKDRPKPPSLVATERH